MNGCSTFVRLGKAGKEDFRWHDLRHTWASWHVQAGTPLNVLQELGGWESVDMVRRYAHLAVDHLTEYAYRLARPRVIVHDTITSHSLQKGRTKLLGCRLGVRGFC